MSMLLGWGLAGAGGGLSMMNQGDLDVTKHNTITHTHTHTWDGWMVREIPESSARRLEDDLLWVGLSSLSILTWRRLKSACRRSMERVRTAWLSRAWLTWDWYTTASSCSLPAFCPSCCTCTLIGVTWELTSCWNLSCCRVWYRSLFKDSLLYTYHCVDSQITSIYTYQSNLHNPPKINPFTL